MVCTSLTRIVLRCGTDNSWLSGQGTVITRAVGKSSMTHLGAWLEPSLMCRFLATELAKASARPPIPVPDDVEVCARDGPGKHILINHGEQERHIAMPQPMHDVLSAARARARSGLPHTMSPY